MGNQAVVLAAHHGINAVGSVIVLEKRLAHAAAPTELEFSVLCDGAKKLWSYLLWA